MNVVSNLWELEEAQKALRDGDSLLAQRYIDKALEKVRCMYCHRGAENKPTKPYYKGWVHDYCYIEYSGRGDYVRRHESQQG